MVADKMHFLLFEIEFINTSRPAENTKPKAFKPKPNKKTAHGKEDQALGKVYSSVTVPGYMLLATRFCCGYVSCCCLSRPSAKLYMEG